MKKDKKIIPASGQEKSIAPIKATENISKKSKSGVISNIVTTAMEKAKPKSGKGLTNEGTIVSYDEER